MNFLRQIRNVHSYRKIKHSSNTSGFVTEECESRIFQTTYDSNFINVIMYNFVNVNVNYNYYFYHIFYIILKFVRKYVLPHIIKKHLLSIKNK